MPMKRFMLILTLLIFSTSFIGACSPGPDSALEAKSRLSRNTTFAVSSDDLQSLSRGNTDFALALYHAVQGHDENLFFSPYSISLALAMTYAGARGETEKEMAATMHYTLPQERLHPAFNALDLALASRGDAPGEDERQGSFRLQIANSIWGQSGYEFLATYLDLLAQHYGAGIRLVDFVDATEQARQSINRWVSENTEERIKDLLPQGSVDSSTRLVLANAIYFKAGWREPFEKSATREQDFHLLDGSLIKVPMMSVTAGFAYTEGDGYQAIELPYVGQDVSMVILLPKEGAFEDFEATLERAQLEQIFTSLRYETVRLSMPKFNYESSFDLSGTLIDLGMPSAFGLGGTDFSGMDGTRNLLISKVLHKAFVAVDEEGTEAAAATAVIVMEAGIAEPGIEIIIDRPFLYIIRDIPTGSILFMGRVLNPSK